MVTHSSGWDKLLSIGSLNHIPGPKMSARVLILLLIFQLLFFCYHAISLRDTISPTQPLKDGQILISDEGNNFALGFFSPGESTNRRYIGIWYNKVSVQTVVWVANRDNPIMGSDGILSIGEDGDLVLSSRNSTVWSTNITSLNQHHPTKAQLLDSGNLIVLGANENVAWQSFDYPTHVLLPGMKLGVNWKTGFRWFLSSWRSSDDPGQGDYTFRTGRLANPKSGSTSDIFLYKNGSEPVWRSGPWVGNRYSGVVEMTPGYVINFSVVDTPDEVYASYTSLEEGSVVPTFVLDGESGTFQLNMWDTESSRKWTKWGPEPQDGCDNYAHCGAFGLCNSLSINQFECSCFAGYKPKSPRNWYLRDGLDGCVRATNFSMCQAGEGFLKLSNIKVPDTTNAQTNKSKSLAECRKECINNCLCLGYTSATDARVAGGPNGCIQFYGDLIDARVYSATGGQDLYFRVDATELAKDLEKSKGHTQKKRLVVLLVCIGLIFVTFVTSLAYWFYRKNRREWREQEERSLLLGVVEESNLNSSSLAFSFGTILAGTQNFDHTKLLGKGGFGPVYKGELSNGQEIAVKRLSANSGQGINEFKNEVRLISKLQHKNLVRTLGYCISGAEKMLVYEFLPNKSLDKYIFDEEKKLLLDWSKRHEIIIGIARGVLYLHQDSRLKIIHRDLKVSNVLLDANMTPKISDFGMARIFGHDQNEENTNRVVGTYGYMSPEYAMKGLFSIKSDVFSFGIIMLEIISGKRISRYYNDHFSTNLSGYAWKLWKDENAMELVDKSILSSICGFEDEILKCIQIGLLCVQDSPNERPTMLEVTFMLCNETKLSSPNEPAFVIKGNNHNKGVSSTGTHSLNKFTDTEVTAR